MTLYKKNKDLSILSAIVDIMVGLGSKNSDKATPVRDMVI